MNEEEIRGKLLLPYLNDLGLDLSEISLETSFTIRLGKSQHTINGRSDILCKRNGKNLFIVELKADSVAISQKDIDQGISYARALIDDIAPFVVITNGKTTMIFDSISKVNLTGRQISEQSDFWKNGYTLSTDEELRVRYEALKNFVSFSGENLRNFCKSQVQDRMGPIVGNIDEPTSKFIKDLYVQRNDLQSSFNNFIKDKASFFAVVGTAGVGKTNTICSLALQCLENNFVFFYNAAIISKSPLEHIAQDLNGVFSSKSESNLVLKRLDELGRFLDKTVFLFIDAVDESINTNISLELSELAMATKNLNKIKICISCKSNIWENILKVNDTPNHLFEELDKFHERILKLGNNPGFLLEDFSEEELKEIIPLYRKVFGFRGEISGTLLKELRNGFFLRIFSEVYSHKQIPEKIDDKNLIKTYLKQSFEKSNIDFQTGMRILSKIGIVLINHKYSELDAFYDDGLEIETLLENLNFSLNESLPEDLFARNILTKSNKEDSYNISFYYSKIRDYVICFHSYKLDQLSDNEFYNILDDFYGNYIGQSAIEFYLNNASEGHKYTLINYKKSKALAYVENYNSYLEENFKNSKKLYLPKTDDEIGIVLPTDLIKKDGYALFRIKPGESEKILYENLEDAFSGDHWSSRMYEIGVSTIYSSNHSLLVPDLSKVVKKEIFKQLKGIIQKGRLNAYNSDILIMEQVSLIVYYYQKQLGYNGCLDDLYMPRFEQIYPIDLKDLQNRIYRFIAYEYYRGIDYNIPSSTVHRMVEEAVQNNLYIPKLNITGDFPPFEELSKIVTILQEKGFQKLEKHHLPYPNKSLIEVRSFFQKNNIQDIEECRCFQYTADQAKLYIECFFRHLENCYKDFIEYLFPTFKNELTFFNGMPYEYFFYMKDADVLKWGMFGYRSSKDGQTKFNFRESVPMEKAFKEDRIKSLQGFSLEDILRSDYHNDIRTIDKFNTSKVDDFCVIRNWVYKLLKDDMRDILKEYNEYI
ncbi:type I restriction enzyme HsdR N-terminal domain-containing protein [Solitalea canadensis]|uniref:Putative NTPase (NACHT family) n=1 Tax=Solitalea canadensis (strain ATCC 29591 / DSM 3403 / JCM 21819 / LMG 8368 / NBRC 15130 / NCIMB 12057 / USAM 9D) TaxID=929556 RepID=H8KVG5_SOLCM|nr:type I restriction enzyme HsdR N-terminal domain-containing protein [Solitalea canadensis]AFD06345.1 putative NTPase (NACHT family) [Solitalea canadensis DSM 3403]